RLLKAGMFPNHVGQLKAVYVRHADIHQDHRDFGLEQMFERLPARVGFHESFSQGAEDGLVAEELTGLVIHHQDVDWVVLTHTFYRCNHMRNAESNCSVLTALSRYSEAPASRHFSRSPFMAFAVKATMGRRRKDGFCRMTCMVS